MVKKYAYRFAVLYFGSAVLIGLAIGIYKSF